MYHLGLIGSIILNFGIIAPLMTEGTPLSQEPQELNHRLLALYDLLPDRDVRFVMDPPTPIQESIGLSGLGRFVKPEISEIKNKIMSELANLLDKASITSAFKEKIVELFEGLCDYGSSKSDPDPDHEEFKRLMYGDKFADERERDFVYDSIIRNSQDGGGIFDPNDAVRIERIAYGLEFLGTVAGIEAMRRLTRNLNEMGGNNREYQPDPNSPNAKRMQKWRQEFIEHYKEEP